MDDFLHNLRNQTNKRFDRNRNKPYDGQFRPNDRFAGRDRKSNPQQRKPADSDQWPAIKRLIEGLLEQQRRLADFGERTVRAAERQAEALESIARQFKPTRPEAPPATVRTLDSAAPAEAPATSAVDASDHDATPDAKTVILQQRSLGQSFDQIAHDLNDRSIATLSGKGQWRAQTVSRLYNTLVPAEPAAIAAPAAPAED